MNDGGAYVCAGCGGEFTKNRPDSEADAEALENFGVADASQRDDFAIVCDDCYELMMAFKRTET